MAQHSAFWDYVALDPIRVQIQTREVTEQEFMSRLAELKHEVETWNREQKRAFVVIEGRGIGRPKPTIRKLQADWLRDNADLLSKTTVGIAFVISSRMARGALTAIFWMSESPAPYSVHATLASALAHAEKACREAGLALPPELQAKNAADQVEAAFASDGCVIANHN